MQLTERQQEQMLAKLNELWKDLKCEVCDHQDWVIADRLYAPPVYNRGSTSDGPGLIPMVVASCNNCGNVKMVNAITIGLIDSKGRWIDAT
jgi:hypothetical protein